MLTIVFGVVILAVCLSVLYATPVPEPWKKIIMLVIVLLFVLWLFSAWGWNAGPPAPVIVAPR